MTKKPKGKTPSLLAQSTGKPIIDKCTRKTKCIRCKQDLLAGDCVIKIPKVESSYANKKSHCLECFKLILEQTKNDISDLEGLIAE